MLEIKFPNFVDIAVTTYGSQQMSFEDLFKVWFDREIKPINDILSEAKVVYSWRDGTGYCWRGEETDIGKQAYLIDIKDIQKPTAKSVLIEFIDTFAHGGNLVEVIEKAKKVIAEEE